MKPDNFEDISAVLALYRPGPMGANSHTNYALRKNGLAGDHADPPGAGGAAGGDPRRDLRPDRLPGAGAARRAEARRLHASARPTCCAGRWARRRRRSSTRSSSRSATACGATATPTRRSRRCGTSWSRSPTTPSTRRTPPATAWCRTGPPTSRPTTRPSTWPALLTSVGDDKDKMALYLAECRRMGIKVLPPDVNDLRRPVHRRSARTSGSAWPRSATSARTWWPRSCAAGRRRATTPTSTTSSRKVDAVACNKKTIESLIKAGAFDSLGHTRKGLLAVHAEAIDAFADIKRNEAAGQYDLFGGGLRRRRRRAGGTVAMPAIAGHRVGQAGPARLRAGDARPVRLRPPAVRVGARPERGGRHHHRRAGRGRARSPTGRSSPSPGSSPACSGGSPSRAGPGRRPPWRTSPAGSRRSSSPTPTR